MDFGFSEEQEMLRSSARDFLAKEAPMTYVRKMMDDEVGFTAELWKKMADLGWMGLILPEQYGGSGLDFVDLIVVLEEMGRVVLPGPFFSTVVLGGVALLDGGSAAQKDALLPKLASGELRVTLAQLEPSGRWDADGIQLAAKADGGGFVLSGTKLFVPDAHTADHMVVAGRAPGSTGTDGITLFLVDAKAPGHHDDAAEDHGPDAQARGGRPEGRPRAGGPRARSGRPGLGAARSRDRSRQGGAVRGDVRRRAAGARDERRLRQGARAVRQAHRQLPGDPAQVRQHAGRGGELEVGRRTTPPGRWRTAWRKRRSPRRWRRRTAPTRIATSSGEGIQIHGGIGFTWEHDMHIYFKRAKSSEVTFGDATWNRELVAQHINL